MRTAKDTPAFVRYFNAKAKPFTKPIFWSSLGVFFLTAVAIYQYWQHPEWLQSNSQSVPSTASIEGETDSDVSPEDLAIAADLDNVDLLIKELEKNQTLSAIAAENSQKLVPELKREESKFSRLQKQQRARLSNSQKLSSNSDLKAYSGGIGTNNQKINELLQPPSFTSYQSSRSNNTSFKGTSTSQADIIPNPVGNIYLSNRSNFRGSSVAPITPNGGKNNSATLNTNDFNRETSAAYNTQNSQVNNQPAAISSNPNRFVPASSLIQSQQTPAAPVFNLGTPSSATGVNSPNLVENSYSNPYSTTNLGTNPVNGINPNSVNGNRVNGVNNSTNNPGTTPQAAPNQTVSGLATGFGYLNTRNISGTANNNSPNLLQNNYRSSQLVTPSYNRSTPVGYQLQPQNYSRNGFGQNNNGLNNTVGINRNRVNNLNNNSAQSINNNAPITVPFGNPSLQPSGILSTSEVGR